MAGFARGKCLYAALGWVAAGYLHALPGPDLNDHMLLVYKVFETSWRYVL